MKFNTWHKDKKVRATMKYLARFKNIDSHDQATKVVRNYVEQLGITINTSNTTKRLKRCCDIVQKDFNAFVQHCNKVLPKD